MAPDATWANITGFIPDRLEVIADEIDVLGSAVMGLTHEVRPLPQPQVRPDPAARLLPPGRRLQGRLDEYDWLKPDVRPGLGPESIDVLPAGCCLSSPRPSGERGRRTNARSQKEIDALKTAIDQRVRLAGQKYVEERLAQMPDELRDDLKAMLGHRSREARRGAALPRREVREATADRPQRLKTLDSEFKKESDETDARVRAIQAQRQPEPKIQALWDRGEPSPTYVYRRGDSLSPGRLVGPGVPSVLTDGKTPFEVKPPWPGAKQDRPAAGLRALADAARPPAHGPRDGEPLWKHHFGTGIVTTLGNFGKAGAPPTHPELLDWLAREFVRQGWSLKAMHRLMMTSTDLSAGVRRHAGAREARPGQRALLADAARAARRRVALRLAPARRGPAGRDARRPGRRRAGRARDGLVTPDGTAKGWRRMIYVQQTRKQTADAPGELRLPADEPELPRAPRFDRRPAGAPPDEQRHGRRNWPSDFAKRVRREAGTDPADRSSGLPDRPEPPADRRGEEARREALKQLADEWAKQLAAREARPRRGRAEGAGDVLSRDPELGGVSVRGLSGGVGMTRLRGMDSTGLTPSR